MGEKYQFTLRTNNPSLTTGSTTLFEGLVQVRRQRIMRPPNWKLSMLYKVYHLINRPLLSESGNVNPQYELVWAVEHHGWNPISVGSLGWLGREQEVYRHCPRGHADRGPTLMLDSQTEQHRWRKERGGWCTDPCLGYTMAPPASLIQRYRQHQSYTS